MSVSRQLSLFELCACVWQFVQHKAELLHAVQKLYNMGYKLSGSAGTAEYYSAKGIKVCQNDACYV